MSTTSHSTSQVTPYRVLDGIVYLLGISLTLLTVGYATTLAFGLPTFTETDEYVNVFLGLGLALYYFDYARSQFDEPDESVPDADESATAADTEPAASDASVVESDRLFGSNRFVRRLESAYGRIDPFLALVFGVAAVIAVAYVHVHYDRLTGAAHIVGYTSTDHIVGAVLVLLAIDATRRAFGNIIAGVAVFSIVYAHASVGPNLFGVFEHTGMTWTTIFEAGAISVSGVYDSTLMGIGSTWVAIFIMFAGIAKAYGLMDFVLEVGRELGSSLRTGVVQIAVISSMVMGSITGSAAANTATTGSFTIPMLKEQGVRDDFAASIEAVASAGGQMLPPVMGVAAFLMADFTGVSYVQIIQAGVIPAALFYLSVCIAVHFTILKFGWISHDLSSFDKRVLLSGIHFVIPLGVLLYTLVYLQYTPLSAGMYTIFTIIGVMILMNFGGDLRDGALNLETAKGTARQTTDGLYQGGIEMAPLVGVLAAMGLIVELLEGTGLTQRVATTIISLGGGLLVVILILAMIASIMFGLGMPTPAAYVLVVVLVVPGLTEMGVLEITAHMFVFYFAMLSAITPPVAISVAIGSRIAGAGFLQSCVQALRIGAPGFVIPFSFIVNDSLIYWSLPETLIAFPVVLAGTIGLIVATVGFDGARDLSYPIRGIYVVAAFAAMFGSIIHTTVQIAAAAIIIGSLVYARTIVGYDVERSAETQAVD